VDFVRLASSLGLDAVQFSHRRDFKAGEFRLLQQEKLAPLLEEAAALGEKEGLTVTVPALRASEEFRCRFLQSAYLWLAGDIVPCCRMLPGAYPGPKRFFGNVADRSLGDIWNGEEYRTFRSRVLSGEHPEVCRRCPYAAGLLT
jgi:radical SAM protein with 4Fe4S-binding SPASM domain